LRVPQPEFACTGRAYSEAIPRLHICAGEIAQIVKIVYRTVSLHPGHAKAPDTQSTDGEVVLLALEDQCSAAEIAAADEGNLHLLDRHGASLHKVGCKGRRRQTEGRRTAESLQQSAPG